MTLRFKVETRGNATRVINRQIGKIKDSKALERIAKNEVTEIRRRIRSTKMDPDGRPWKPWATATKEERRRKGNSTRGLLYESGALWRSISAQVKKTRIVISSDLRYARFLRLGRRTPTQMPAREFLGWSRKSLPRIRRLFVKEVRLRT